jgi:proteic killer suppression protein
VFHGVDSKRARGVCPGTLRGVAMRRLDQLQWADSLGDLTTPRSNRLEALNGDREGQHSIRINRRYRICFEWTRKGPVAVEIVDYH